MHGFIFVIWRKCVSEGFGNSLLQASRTAMRERVADTPLANRLYNDALLLAGGGAPGHLAGHPADALLLEDERSLLINGLTSHHCLSVLSHVSCGPHPSPPHLLAYAHF